MPALSEKHEKALPFLTLVWYTSLRVCLTGLLPPASTVMRPAQQHGCKKGFTHVLVWWMATVCPGRAAPRSGGWLCRKTCQKGKSNAVPGADYRPHHRPFVLGAGLVPEPGALQRLRQSPAARPQLCAERFDHRLADQDRQDRGHRQRLRDLPDHDRDRDVARVCLETNQAGLFAIHRFV